MFHLDAALLPLPELRALSQPVPQRLCGVYFLWRNGEVVYVGESTNVLSRLEQHRADPAKTFDRETWVRCTADTRKSLERAYLDLYLPVLNKDAITCRLRAARRVRESARPAQADQE